MGGTVDAVRLRRTASTVFPDNRRHGRPSCARSTVPPLYHARVLALRTLTRRKTRTALTVIGVAIGIASVVALIAVARGLRQQFNEFFLTGQAHLVVTRAGAADPFLSYLPDGLIDELQAFDDVARAFPFLFAARQVPGQPFFFIYGTTEGSPFLAQTRTIQGRGLFDTGAPRPISLGRTIAAQLDLSVGSTVAFGRDEFEVVGIFESSTPLMEAGGMLAFADAQRVAGLEGKMSLALVHFHDAGPEMIAAGKAAIEAALPDVTATVPAEFSRAFDEFDLLDQVVVVFTILAVFAGGIGVMNTMLMSVFERTREIGILQAIGWSKAMIVRQVIVEGLIVCLLAGPLGIGMGVVGLLLISSIGELGWVAGDYGPSVFVLALGVAVGMGMVGAIYPALHAVRITPIEALRYE